VLETPLPGKSKEVEMQSTVYSEVGLSASIKFQSRRQAWRALEHDMQDAQVADGNLSADVAELVAAGCTDMQKAQAARRIDALSGLIRELSAVVEFAVSNPGEAVQYYLE
jgi:hypothetical protein